LGSLSESIRATVNTRTEAVVMMTASIIVWNYTERRAETPTLCAFYNSDFLIYSSMGSFYIPCVIMICLYSRIFMAIR